MSHDKCHSQSSKLFRGIEQKFNKTVNKLRGPHQPNAVFIPTGNNPRIPIPRSVSSNGPRMTNGILYPHHSEGLNNSGFAHPGIQPSSSATQQPPPYPVQPPNTSYLSPAGNVGNRRGSSPSSSTSTGGSSTYNGFVMAPPKESPLTIRAQRDNLQMTRELCTRAQGELDSALRNIDDLNEYLAEKLSELDGESLDIDSIPFDVLNAQINSLKDELEVLRRRAPDPSIIPPDRPPKPSSRDNSWNCVKCSERNSDSIYSCKRCRFPRTVVDPVEMVKCRDPRNRTRCDICSNAAADLLCVSSCPGDDEWLLVNKLNSPQSS